MDLPRAEIRIVVLALWVPVTAIGWGVYTWVIVPGVPGASLETGLRIGLSEGVIIGLAMGVAQSLLLRAFVTGAIRWLLPTFIGWILGGTVGGVVLALIDSIKDVDTIYGFSLAVKGVIVGAVVGAVIGVCQWAALRVWVRGAYRWILATIIGCSVGAPFGWVVGFMLSWPFVQLLGEAGWPYYVELAIISGSLASGAVLGLVTSLTLKILFSAAEPKKTSSGMERGRT
jgi:hypothetical protein